MSSPSLKRFAWLSIAAAIGTIGLKGAAWWLTGSIGLLSDALESLVNLAGAIMALAMITLAEQPADEQHTYGHGKAEYFSSGFEGLLILLAAIAIGVSATHRLLNPQALSDIGIGLLVSVAASALNFTVARVLQTAGRRYRSLTLEADAQHLMTDVWTSAGVVVGVGATVATGALWLDPLIALLVAGNIVWSGWKLIHRSASGLMDRALSDAEVAAIERTLTEAAPPGCTHSKLRTRAAGALHFAHVELCVPGDWTVAEAHAVADALERIVLERTGTRLATHLEPIPPTAPSGAEADLT